MKKYRAKILMLLENPFPEDPRVKNEASKLTEAGYKVYIIAQRFMDDVKLKEEVNGITVYRVPILDLFKKTCSGDSLMQLFIFRIKSFIGYVTEYFYFTIISLIMSSYILIRHGFDVIHINNPPNTLFIIGTFYRILGKKFVFDHHDLVPELYLSKFRVKPNLVYRSLVIEEKLCLKLANMVIATNDSYKRIEIERAHIKPEKIFVVRNGPDPERVRLLPPNPELRKMEKTIICYMGIMGPQDGVDYLLRALEFLAYDLRRKDFYCVIMGRGDTLEDLKALASELKLDNFVRFTGFIPTEHLMRNLSAADICVDPDPSSPLNDVSTWIKIMEYMTLGKAIVSFDLKESRFSAQDAAIYVTPNDEEEFAYAISKLMDDHELRLRMGEFGRKRVEAELSWPHVSENLLLAYEWLFDSAKATKRAARV